MRKPSLRTLVITLLGFFLLFFLAFSLEQQDLLGSVSLQEAAFLTLLGLIVLAGILDGFNPCAFATLLLWSGFLLNRFGSHIGSEEEMANARRKLISYALLYALGIVSVYFIFGAGLLQLSNLINPQDITLLSRLFGFIVTILGVVMIRDSFYAPGKSIIKMPAFLYPLFRKYKEPASNFASFISGIVVGLCSIPCSGAIYLAVLIMIRSEPLVERTTILFFYNVGFVLPVIWFALILANKKLLQAVSREFITSRANMKRMIGAVTILLGVLAIYLS